MCVRLTSREPRSGSSVPASSRDQAIGPCLRGSSQAVRSGPYRRRERRIAGRAADLIGSDDANPNAAADVGVRQAIRVGVGSNARADLSATLPAVVEGRRVSAPGAGRRPQRVTCLIHAAQLRLGQGHWKPDLARVLRVAGRAAEGVGGNDAHAHAAADIGVSEDVRARVGADRDAGLGAALPAVRERLRILTPCSGGSAERLTWLGDAADLRTSDGYWRLADPAV